MLTRQRACQSLAYTQGICMAAPSDIAKSWKVVTRSSCAHSESQTDHAMHMEAFTARYGLVLSLYSMEEWASGRGGCLQAVPVRGSGRELSQTDSNSFMEPVSRCKAQFWALTGPYRQKLQQNRNVS